MTLASILSAIASAIALGLALLANVTNRRVAREMRDIERRLDALEHVSG